MAVPAISVTLGAHWLIGTPAQVFIMSIQSLVPIANAINATLAGSQAQSKLGFRSSKRGASSLLNLANSIGRSAVRRSNARPGPTSVDPVTVQKDFRKTKTKTKGKKSKKQQAIAKVKKFKNKKFKMKVKKALRVPRYIAVFTENIGRSFLSQTNGSCVVFIPIYGWRGPDTSSSSDARAAAFPARGDYWFRGDQQTRMLEFYKQTRWFPSGAAANTQQLQYWYYHKHTTLDITLSANGRNDEVGGTISRTHPVEYEIYFVKPGKKMPKTDQGVNTVGPLDVQTLYQAQQQRFGSASAGAYPAYTGVGVGTVDPGWFPYLEPYSKSYLKCKKLGEGYIAHNSQQRFKFSRNRKKGLMTKKLIDSLDPGANSNVMTLYPGQSCGLYVVFRGVPTATTTQISGYPQSRLTFNCNWVHYTFTSGIPQAGKDTYQLGPDSYT